MKALLAAAWLCAAPSAAQGDAASEDTQAVAQAKEKLDEPGAKDELARRILNSKLVAMIGNAQDRPGRLAQIREWIASDPDSAALAMVALDKDQAEGATRYEDMLLHRGGGRGGFSWRLGTLKSIADDSEKVRQEAQMTDEEKRELLKTMFEGGHGMGEKVLTQEKGESGAGPAFAGGFYDRLSAANARGYSPQVLAIQSSLNQRRPPGAPKLVETGKLDYETLSYPAFGMRYDLGNLAARLRAEKNYALVKLLGLEGRTKGQELSSEALEAELSEKAKGKSLPPRLLRRAAILQRVGKALEDFDAAAQSARDPARIDARLLRELGARQREAARWITAAGLEEELSRVEAEEGFWTPELAAAIEACPVPAGVRAAYKKRGEDYRRKLASLKAGDERAAQALASDDWLARVPAVESALAEAGRLRQNLSRNIADYVQTAFRLASSVRAKPRWRAWLEAAAKRLMPSSAYARGLLAEERSIAVLKDVFGKIATGDLDAAHTILANVSSR